MSDDKKPNLRPAPAQEIEESLSFALRFAADPRHFGVRIGITAVLHTWGSALTHHPHIHMIVPGGGISLDGQRWISARPAFLLPVRVLRSLFRRLFLTRLLELHAAGKLKFFGKQAELADPTALRQRVALVRKRPGWSTPSRRLRARRPCWPICRATRTGSPYPPAG